MKKSFQFYIQESVGTPTRWDCCTVVYSRLALLIRALLCAVSPQCMAHSHSLKRITMRKQFENLLHLTCLPIQFNIYMVLIISSKQFYCPCGMVCHISMTANKHFFRFCSIILPISISNVCTVSYMYLSIICKFNTHMHKYSMCHRKDQQPTALLP